MSPNEPTPRTRLDRLVAWVIAVPVVAGGITLTHLGGRMLLVGAAPWTWETRQCDVVDARVRTREPGSGGFWSAGRYELTFDLVDRTTGVLHRGSPPMAHPQIFWDESAYGRELLRATPGSTVDCWVGAGDRVSIEDGAGTAVAYVRRVPLFILAQDVALVLFGLALVAGGLMMMRPGLIDRLGNIVAARWRK